MFCPFLFCAQGGGEVAAELAAEILYAEWSFWALLLRRSADHDWYCISQEKLESRKQALLSLVDWAILLPRPFSVQQKRTVQVDHREGANNLDARNIKKQKWLFMAFQCFSWLFNTREILWLNFPRFSGQQSFLKDIGGFKASTKNVKRQTPQKTSWCNMRQEAIDLWSCTSTDPLALLNTPDWHCNRME